MAGIQNKSWDNLTNLIKDSQSILLSTHINSDGDGLGSEIAFYYYLKSLDKDYRIVNSSPLPKHYKFIDPENIIEQYDSNIHSKWMKNCRGEDSG